MSSCSIRARQVANTYINATIIPSLCRKAGVPTTDARGNITSHRARSTIASQLYNAKEPGVQAGPACRAAAVAEFRNCDVPG
jgi:hypothetical protein